MPAKTNSKKKSDEHLQEVRNKNSNGVRYRKRVQEEHEADEQLKDFERGREDDTFPKI